MVTTVQQSAFRQTPGRETPSPETAAWSELFFGNSQFPFKVCKEGIAWARSTIYLNEEALKQCDAFEGAIKVAGEGFQRAFLITDTLSLLSECVELPSAFMDGSDEPILERIAHIARGIFLDTIPTLFRDIGLLLDSMHSLQFVDLTEMASILKSNILLCGIAININALYKNYAAYTNPESDALTQQIALLKMGKAATDIGVTALSTALPGSAAAVLLLASTTKLCLSIAEKYYSSIQKQTDDSSAHEGLLKAPSSMYLV